MSLTIGCGRQISGPPGSCIEMGPQGVPQTGKIIEVKKTTFRVLFFRDPIAWRFCFGLYGSVGCLKTLVILIDVAKTELRLFCAFCQAK